MVKGEEAPLIVGAPGAFGESVEATVSCEQQVTEAEGMDGLVLRYGWFYGPGTYFGLDGSTAEDVRRRRFPVVGKGTGVSSFIHVDDAAAATVAAVERGEPGIYNVVDDDPAPMSEWVPAYAEAIGAKPPRRIPAWLARLIAGKETVGDGDRAARRLEREGEGRARLGAGLRELAPGLPPGPLAGG